MDFISYLKTLNSDDWNKMVTSKWTVKDVVAHMIGWEKGDVSVIINSWETKQPPWWKLKNEDDEFNAKSVEFYKGFSPKKLIKEWEKWQRKVREVVDDIGEEKLKTRMDLFAWLFEGINDDRPDGKASHYKHHYE
ncbi:MAG: hypothetical protein WAX44_03035 [Minisyncoccia bacterium]